MTRGETEDDGRARPGWTFTDNLRLLRRLPLLVRLLAVAIPLAAVGVAALPAPWTPLPGTLIGVPVIVWLLHRAQEREGEGTGERSRTEE